MKILSICIPTYNRINQLEELVKSLLEVQSDDFEIVITNNCSTDDTLKMLSGIKDKRLVVYTNEKPEPAYYNMVLSIFNASGKYALYCNDRDVIFAERLISFIDFLKNHEYSYLHIAKCYGNPSYKLSEYEKGFDSLIHQSYSEHPTGMVFNVILLKAHLQKENYLKYVDYTYTYCFLSRDLSIFEKTAEYDNYLWDERPSIFKVQSASGAIYKRQLFFDTEKIIDYMRSVIEHLVENPYFSLTSEQQKELILNVFLSFCNKIIAKKRYYADKRECAHYRIKPRYVSYCEIKKSYMFYFEECDKTLLKTMFYDDLINDWSRKKDMILKSLLKDYIRCDFSILKTKIKRFLNPQYHY